MKTKKMWELYVSLGWRIFPLHGIDSAGQCTCHHVDCAQAGKHPLVGRWPETATDAIEQIENWAEEWPSCNWALACGQRSGVLAIDIDPRHGGVESLKDLEKELGPLAETVMSLTGGGGYHYLFQCADFNISNRVGFRPGIDIRSERGYIVLPPSRHKSGRRYDWEVNHHPEDILLARLPDTWLSALATIGFKRKPEHVIERWEPMPIDEARRITPKVCPRLHRYISPEGATMVTYEEWVAMASWAHALTDNSDLFHEWSRADPIRYDRQETERKWSQTETLHPISCERMQRSHPMSVCQDCLRRNKGGGGQ